MKILKHSARSFLQVTLGSKVMSWFVFRADSFLAFLVAVSDRLSVLGGAVSGFSFGVISWSLVNASVAHAWGLRQFFCLSLSQSWQRQ